MVKFHHFFSAFNNAYNNNLRFFYFRKFSGLEKLLKMFLSRGLILGFVIIHEIVIVHLRYIQDIPFIRIIVISRNNRKIFFTKKQYVQGRLSGNEIYILNSPTKGFYFSDSFKNAFFSKHGGEIFVKILYNNENNSSKKNNFI